MQPYVERIFSILETQDIFEALDNGKTACFLDSAMAHERLGRYSFIVTDPFMFFSSAGNRCRIDALGEKPFI